MKKQLTAPLSSAQIQFTNLATELRGLVALGHPGRLRLSPQIGKFGLSLVALCFCRLKLGLRQRSVRAQLLFGVGRFRLECRELREEILDLGIALAQRS